MSLTKIVITVGTGLCKSGESIGIFGLDSMYRNAKLYLLEQCGAYQLHTIQGGWRDEGKDWVEPGIVFSVCVDITKLGVSPERIAENLRDIFDQKCVALETYPVDFRLI